ncbi:translation initiation factor 2 [Paenibacillus rhizovicinus]|uniref:Translation initiation factor 2 n=1 Tax=Paenibacillus rhizovicinus TaxID=2704463 RepID=A0A6C0NVB3_9BACL|nr:translation initiation factor 2 [Paenibacillus rhizovicinus]QHW30129.1 translation initiation factor 2 [Paenibacillus rhizovicinus]
MPTNNNESSQPSRELLIAKIAFLGASVTLLGDGLSALAAGLALESLENEQRTPYPGVQAQVEPAQKQLDYLINELIQLRKRFR